MSKKATNAPTASEELRLLIERVERLEEEKKGIADDIKDVYAEAKGRGYDPKTIREIVKLRKLSPDQRREREALLDTYKAALGMLDGTPLGKWALDRLEKTDDVTTPVEIDDATYAAAIAKVLEAQNASTSWLQRTLKIGYNAAVGLIERMEREGVVSKPNHVGARTVLRGADGSPNPEPEPEAPPPPEPTVEDARRLGDEAAKSGAPVTANPFPARDPRRAAWDEAWCMALGTDGMDIPDALKPTPKAKKPDGGEGGGDEGGDGE